MSGVSDGGDVDSQCGSLLERMIRRLVAQRACLNHAVGLVREMPGSVLELGLGKARTYDHLRRRLPDRSILVFDREVHAPPAFVPDPQQLFLGDFRDTLRTVITRLRGSIVLAHADIGSKDWARDARLVQDLAPLIDELMCDGGIVLTDRQMRCSRWSRLPLPPEAGDWDYFMYRVDDR